MECHESAKGMNFQDVETEVKRFEVARAALVCLSQNEDSVKASLLADFKHLLCQLGLPARPLSTNGAMVAFLFLHAALGSEQPWELAQDIPGWNRLSANQQEGMGQVARETILRVLAIETPIYNRLIVPSLDEVGALDPSILNAFAMAYRKLSEFILESDKTRSKDEQDYCRDTINTLIQTSFP